MTPERAIAVISSCCILLNVAMARQDHVEQNVDGVHDQQDGPHVADVHRDGAATRNHVVQTHFN